MAGDRLLTQRETEARNLAERLRLCAQAPLERRVLQWTQRQDVLRRAMEFRLQKHEAILEQLLLRLQAASPLAPLERGYALVRDAQGQVLRSVDDAPLHGGVDILLTDGRLAATITEIHGGTP